jgi:general secretion pathway protein K
MSPRRLAREERGLVHLAVSPRRLAREERGFALLAVILVMSLLAVVVTEFAFSMRLEASMVRAYRDGVLARNLAEAGVQQAIREILSDANVQGLDETGQVTFYTVPAGSTALKQLPSLERTQVPLGAGAFSYRISDEEGRLNLNGGVPDRMQRLLTAIGVDKIERDSIVDAIEDWRDANDTTRTNGAESDDYLKLPVPYRARNGNFQDTDELLQVKGITPEMYFGHEDKPALADVLTARGRGTVNINTAPAPVLSALGLSDAEVSNIVQERTNNPYPTVPGRFGGRRMNVGSTTFRIDAEGIVGGEPKARIVAIVQKSATGTGTPPTVTVLSWRPMPLRSPATKEAGKS